MTPRRKASDGAGVAGLSHAAGETLSLLHRAGASFFADIVRGTGRLKSEVEGALWELVAAGLVTADGFDNLRALIDPRRRAGQGQGRAARPRHSAGRWSLLHAAPAGDPARLPPKPTCWMLLRRYGVVFRDLLARESVLPTWRELLVMFRRLEDRGEVRGGRFVAGFIGEQFALPLAVESLRALAAPRAERRHDHDWRGRSAQSGRHPRARRAGACPLGSNGVLSGRRVRAGRAGGLGGAQRRVVASPLSYPCRACTSKLPGRVTRTVIACQPPRVTPAGV